ncbi:methyl-accepting chemotaxis protein [Oharaeibacter diazotrophicus]|uniref:Methyl-accepting chemotaxis protein n=1 Tax=Oharaeibacter diazotrophicus TaxID=1920512 RepID=A0A4R6R602_9HYPH|nr:methyl-accepting chemotaxis protein [Oharaeibacter diazotrophicus]TDP81184.1 methyl-accepting chemotaxis protein [Oharaeibacter diazotrophicus]BBE74822.1 methyl-accepting chemotaxis protein PctC [Pleomorphomonas sp. SM30]GLS75674.1 chemotaxis protein [Oharaeibacter diazotrophicus]
MNLHSIKTRIVVLSTVCLLLTTAALVGANVYSTTTSNAEVSGKVDDLLDRDGRERLRLLASEQAGLIGSEVDTAFQAARATANAVAVMAADGAEATPPERRRQQLNALLLATLKDNPRFNGTYSAAEPNALDGADASYVGRADVGSDATGRSLPYWTRDAGGKIGLQALVEYDSDARHPNGLVKGGWYLGPKATGKESVLAPLPYIVQGKAVHLATMSVPILVGGRFIGVAGADFDLSFVQKLVSDVNATTYDGKGSVTIVTEDGLVVASSDRPDAIGNGIAALGAAWEKDMATIAAARESVEHEEATDLLKVFAPISLGRTGKSWSVVFAVPQAVVMAEATALHDSMIARASGDTSVALLVGLVVIVVAVAGMGLVARGIAGPIGKLTAALQSMARGTAVAEIEGARRRDEIGDIARAVDEIRRQTEAAAAEKARQDEVERERRAAEQREMMRRVAREFETKMGGLVDRVGVGTGELARSAEEMAALAQSSAAQTDAAMSASSTASGSVQVVASAAEELFASIGEINSLIQRSGRIVGDADQHAGATHGIVTSLSETATRIGSVVDIIRTIAAQTNLLALNATIEAARAGEAGKGFAVVANEVKALANQTAKATDEIGGQIEAMRLATESAVNAIGSIRTVVGDIRDAVTSVAGAVEQQSAATSEISRSAQEAARGTSTVSENVGGVQGAIGSTDKAAHAVVGLTREMSGQVHELREGVAAFVRELAA